MAFLPSIQNLIDFIDRNIDKLISMGNQICCDESHQKPGVIEQLEKDVVHKISLADRVRHD